LIARSLHLQKNTIIDKEVNALAAKLGGHGLVGILTHIGIFLSGWRVSVSRGDFLPFFRA
jgi:hypothetical protein